MNVQWQDPSEVEDQTCAQQTEANITRQGNLMHILRISQLQAYIREAKGKLALISRETEGIRRRVKSQAVTHRSLGAVSYSQSEVNDFLALISLLEEENSQLKALSALPVEIEQLKRELQDLSNAEGKVGFEGNGKDLQRSNEVLRLQLEEALKKLKESEEKLQRLSDSSKLDPQSPTERKGEQFISFQKHFQDQFSVSKPAKPLVSASPASNHASTQKSVSPVATKTKPSPHRVQPKMLSFNAGKPKGKSRGYSPTFLRVQKGGDKKRQDSTSPGGKKQVKEEDNFPDCFPEEAEVRAEEQHHVI